VADDVSRRALLGAAVAGAAAVPLARWLPSAAADPAQPVTQENSDPEIGDIADALAALRAGNQRFVDGRMDNSGQDPARRIAVSQAQHPFATVLSCSDSRLPPEVIFDQGFAPRDPSYTNLGAANTLNSESVFVATTRDPLVHYLVPTPDEPVYRYTIEAPGGIDVNATLGSYARHGAEQEIAFPGGIRRENVVGVQRILPPTVHGTNPDGSPRVEIPDDEPFESNPHFNPTLPNVTPPPLLGRVGNGAPLPDATTSRLRRVTKKPLHTASVSEDSDQESSESEDLPDSDYGTNPTSRLDRNQLTAEDSDSESDYGANPRSQSHQDAALESRLDQDLLSGAPSRVEGGAGFADRAIPEGKLHLSGSEHQSDDDVRPAQVGSRVGDQDDSRRDRPGGVGPDPISAGNAIPTANTGEDSGEAGPSSQQTPAARLRGGAAAENISDVPLVGAIVNITDHIDAGIGLGWQ